MSTYRYFRLADTSAPFVDVYRVNDDNDAVEFWTHDGNWEESVLDLELLLDFLDTAWLENERMIEVAVDDVDLIRIVGSASGVLDVR